MKEKKVLSVEDQRNMKQKNKLINNSHTYSLIDKNLQFIHIALIQVGVGDPTLIDISKVNARIAAGQSGSNVLPFNQKEERELIIESGNEKEKEKELEKDQEFQASSDPVQQSDEVLLYPQVQMEPQQESESFLQYKLAEEQQQDLQLQQMLQENEAMNYKLGSMDWGRNSISKDPYTQKKIGMRYQEHNFLGANAIISVPSLSIANP
ncbi:MAG: hypothetical protein EZS28_033517, partial [Streblomastix strix]